MKYQTEYQRNYQKRTPKKFDDNSIEQRKLNEVPIRRSSSLSPSRRHGRSLPSSPNRNNNFAVIGPNEKFSNSHLYRLRQPIKDNSRMTKPREYAILGRNEKFQDNVVYPLRKPVLDNSPRIARPRRKSENHSCGIQTELEKAPHVSFNSQYGRQTVPVRNQIGAQSEYKQQFIWKQPLGDPISDQMLIEDSKVRDRRSDPALPLTFIDPSEKFLTEKTSVAVNTPARIEIDVNKNKPQVNRVVHGPITTIQSKKDQISEYQSRYRPIIDQKKPRTRKAFEAEQAEERKRKEIAQAEHAHTDDEGISSNVNNLGKDFQQKHSHGNLRRWKSEYQTTYKPFWRFDYKNGKWYKDAAAEETGFNPNLFWYKELVSTRKRADEYRANAEADHFNRNHTLQLQTGYSGNKNYLAWDTNDNDDVDSIISIDHDLERQREKETKQQMDERIQSRIHYEKEKQNEKPFITKSDQIAQTDHQINRTVYIDDPIPRQPSLATKAFVRNLGSSSVQQHMSWDSESLHSQQTNSDIDFKSNTARDLHRKHYINNDSNNQSNVIRKSSSLNKQENRGINTHSPITHERQQTNNGYTSPQINERTIQHNNITRPATSFQETRNAAGRASYDTHTFDKRPPIRPHTSMNDYHSYQDGRYKDELTDNNRQQYISPSKSSFQNHLNTLDERFGQTVNTRHKDDDVLSINSARSLSSSCSLASQTLERAQQNMNKYWGDYSPTSTYSPKKPSSARH